MRSRLILLIVTLVCALSFVVAPGTVTQAAGKQITITITEAQFNKYLATVRGRDIKKLTADIIDGGIIVKVNTKWSDLPEYHEHYGVLIRDGKIVTEAGVFDIPGVGALGYADVKQIVPDLVPYLDHNAKIMHTFVLRKIAAKAGSRYKVESVTTGNDQVVIVVTR
jgi:hypothetical protein